MTETEPTNDMLDVRDFLAEHFPVERLQTRSIPALGQLAHVIRNEYETQAYCFIAPTFSAADKLRETMQTDGDGVSAKPGDVTVDRADLQQTVIPLVYGGMESANVAAVARAVEFGCKYVYIVHYASGLDAKSDTALPDDKESYLDALGQIFNIGNALCATVAHLRLHAERDRYEPETLFSSFEIMASAVRGVQEDMPLDDDLFRAAIEQLRLRRLSDAEIDMVNAALTKPVKPKPALQRTKAAQTAAWSRALPGNGTMN